jgi:ribulose-5-phosphate 4-epimerase/fuculose-1-phosphate aldolase
MTQTEMRKKLACIFQICATKGWDNWTYTHISLRLDKFHFLINPFGILYQDVSPENLVVIDIRKKPESYMPTVNPTGIYIHRAIYEKRDDINAIFHLHTPHGVAVSNMVCGLLPMSQYALHFYDNVSYHAYDSLILDEKTQTQRLAEDLGNNNVCFLQNHGTITCGRTIEEAFFYTHHLEEACHVQCLSGHGLIPYHQISHEAALKARQDLLSFEKKLGERDFKAALSLIPIDKRKKFGVF